MILYHFPTSPFSRRVRLAMAHKGIACELRDARADATHAEAVKRLNPFHTVPVLVDGSHVVVHSTAIAHYLDAKVPAPPLWPAGLAGADAFQLTALADTAVELVIDLGTRYHALHEAPGYPAVRDLIVGRAQRTFDRLAERVASSNDGPLCGGQWSGADMALFTMVVWLEGLPLRAETFAPARQIVELGWTLPPALSRWADPHRRRDDVLAL